MTEPDEGSIEGRGREELLPERGDPFQKNTDFPADEAPNPDADVLPRGQERSQADEIEPHSEGQNSDKLPSAPSRKQRQDGGMGAVGPPLPEDLLESSVPPPSVELELPPPPDSDLHSLVISDLSHDEPVVDRVEDPSIQTDKGLGTKADSLLVSELRWKRLYAKADLLREKVSKEIENPHLKRLLLDQITIACDRELSTREQFEESERILNEVDERVNLEEQVRQLSASLKTWVLAYELVFICLSLVGLLLLPSLIRDYFPTWFSSVSPTIQASIGTMLRSMIWGGLGGGVSALVGLWAHQEFDQDLDRQWAIWFFANPLMGVVIGALIFLLSRAVLVGVFPSVASDFRAGWIFYLISAIAGFKQNVFYTFFDRLFKISDGKSR